MLRYPMFLALLVCPVVAGAQAPTVPNGSIAIGYRQKVDGKLGRAVHRIELSCWDDQCTMTTLTLNECTSVPDGEAFYPAVEHTATTEGTLEVRRAGPLALTIEEKYGGVEFKYRVSFTARWDSTLALKLQLKQNMFFMAITAFSGAATQSSPSSKRLVTWDLIPLRRGQEIVRLRCGAYVEAIP